MAKGIAIKVFGDYACFSRPEFKVERVSYPVITPSAARGVLEAIFWKPEIRYQVREIHVLSIGTQTTILRNEVADRQGAGPFVAQDKRQQRTSLLLKDVAYVIRAEIHVREYAKTEIGGYLDQFSRRVRKGQCHHTPYLGTREFAAFFEEADPEKRGNPGIELPIGQMLFDIAFVEAPDEKEGLDFFRSDSAGRRKVHGRAVPLFFDAQVHEGVLEVPRERYRDLYAMEAEHA